MRCHHEFLDHHAPVIPHLLLFPCGLQDNILPQAHSEQGTHATLSFGATSLPPALLYCAADSTLDPDPEPHKRDFSAWKLKVCERNILYVSRKTWSRERRRFVGILPWSLAKAGRRESSRYFSCCLGKNKNENIKVILLSLWICCLFLILHAVVFYSTFCF